MKQEVLNALGGGRQVLKPRYRAVMMALGAVLLLVALEILHATLLNKHAHGVLIVKHHVAFMVLAGLLIYITGTLGALLFRAAFVSRPLIKR